MARRMPRTPTPTATPPGRSGAARPAQPTRSRFYACFSASRAGTNVTVAWQSVAGVTYFLERSTNLSASPPFTLLAPNLPGQPGTTTYTDTNAASLAPLFYRVGVQ